MHDGHGAYLDEILMFFSLEQPFLQTPDHIGFTKVLSTVSIANQNKEQEEKGIVTHKISLLMFCRRLLRHEVMTGFFYSFA